MPCRPVAASKARQLKRGVKEVVKSLRKGEKGLLLLASNITPIDILSHLPVLAEEAGVKYCWVLAKSVPLLRSGRRPLGLSEQSKPLRTDTPSARPAGRSSARLPAPSGRRRASSSARLSVRAKLARPMTARTPTGRRDGTSFSRRSPSSCVAPSAASSTAGLCADAPSFPFASLFAGPEDPVLDSLWQGYICISSGLFTSRARPSGHSRTP
jgi:hypothetical protein